MTTCDTAGGFLYWSSRTVHRTPRRTAGTQLESQRGAADGAVAKEVTVSTLGVLYAGTDDDGDTAVLSQRLTEVNPQTGVSDFNKANALSFLVFVLLYFPCLASLVAIKQEAGGWKWAAFSFVYNTWWRG